MTREQMIAKAKRLRAEDKSDTQIARALGVPVPTVFGWLGGTPRPQRVCPACGGTFQPRHGNQRFCCGDNARKRMWERGECPRCGGVLATANRSDRCESCWKEDQHRKGRERTEEVIALRQEGLFNYEIEARLGLPYNTAATLLNRAHRFGLEVPRSPYWSRRRVAA